MKAVTTAEQASPLLSEQVRCEIDQWTVKYPPEQRQSAVLPSLLIAQAHNNGWLSRELMDAVADYLGMPAVSVYEVSTFYTMYELAPVGRYKIEVCTNISCLLAGCEKIVKHLKNRLGIGFGETTADGQFTLKEAECLGACANAPMFQLGQDYHEDLTPEKVDAILAKLEDKKNGE
jgi:NADH-quinone oxidoreductase subunit E